MSPSVQAGTFDQPLELADVFGILSLRRALFTPTNELEDLALHGEDIRDDDVIGVPWD
jgi:hypothetical protein